MKIVHKVVNFNIIKIMTQWERRSLGGFQEEKDKKSSTDKYHRNWLNVKIDLHPFISVGIKRDKWDIIAPYSIVVGREGS